MRRIVVATVLMLLGTVSALAEGVPKQSKIWTPQQIPAYLESDISTGFMYMGVLGSYAWLDDEGQETGLEDELWRAGLNIGYLAKMKNLGLGIDLEALRHFDDEFEQENELHNWDFSARARVGFFMSPALMPYVTGGYAWRPGRDDSLVYGLGTELFTNERMSLRVEALMYAEDDDVVDVRTGVNFKF